MVFFYILFKIEHNINVVYERSDIIKKYIIISFLSLLIIPYKIFAYSDYIIASGKTVGIKLNTDGILVMGSYNINGHNNLSESNLKEGDIITKINDYNVNNIADLTNIINECNCSSINIEYKRNNEKLNSTLKLYKNDDSIKTGLFVKDTISGVGTLTYIDPNTNIFGVLGHEITDSSTGNIISIKNGSIFDSNITSITKSTIGSPGSKNAILYSDKIYGSIYENTKKGIFGNYTKSIDINKMYKVADITDIRLGKAKILTVIKGNKVEEFDVNVTKIKNTNDKLKNLEIEITDKKLLEETNGIVQGMSGSPIIQGEYIIGAVTHVIVDNPKKGYGILIKNMLEEAEN